MKKNTISDLPKTEINLKKRYLIWLYKTIKEPLDRIDRKFTQLDIDKKIFKSLKVIKIKDKTTWQKLLDEFKDYIQKKERDGLSLKHIDSSGKLNVDYLFLKNKLRIVEQLIYQMFGKKELQRIRFLYEQEMTRRILEEREHR